MTAPAPMPGRHAPGRESERAPAVRVQFVRLAPPGERLAHAAMLGALEPLRACLPPAQSLRLARLRQPADQLRHLVAHAALRLELGRRLGLPPAAVPIRTRPHGKPVLDAPPAPGPNGRRASGAHPGHDPDQGSAGALHFSLSHAGDWVALAWSSRPVGVDVEAAAAATPVPQGLLPVCATPAEQAATARAADPDAAFLRLWTAKEAVLKAHGTGLALPMNGFALGDPGPDGWQPALPWAHADARPGPLDDLAGYRARPLAVDARHAAAVALAPTPAVPATAPACAPVTAEYFDARELLARAESLWSLQP